MLPDRVSNPGPLTYESGALPIALRGPAISYSNVLIPNGITNNIGVGRFRILGGGGGGGGGGARFRILWGGDQIPSRHMTSY